MAKGLQHYSVVQAQNAQLGQNGFDIYYNGATPSDVSGKWVALQALGVSANSLVLVHAETSIGKNFKATKIIKLTTKKINSQRLCPNIQTFL